MQSARLLRFFALYCALLAAAIDGHPQDNWQGGNGGNWSVGSNWTTGLPRPTDNVVIYSGGTDLVYLDASPTINSLTLGGPGYTPQSQIFDQATPQTLTISGALTLNTSGVLTLTSTTLLVGADSSNAGSMNLSGSSSASFGGNFDNKGGLTAIGFNTAGTFTNEAAAFANFQGGASSLGSFANHGFLEVASGASLTVAGGPLVTDIPTTANYFVYGDFSIGGGDAFASLTSIEGPLYLYGQTSNLTPLGGTLTMAATAQLSANDATNLTVNGNVDNSGYLFTGFDGNGNNTVTITGSMTNEVSGTFLLGNGGRYGDTATINGNLINYGAVGLSGFFNTLNINGDVTNYGLISTACGECYGGQNTITILGNMTNQPAGQFALVGPGDTATIGKNLVNAGNIYLDGGTALTISGSVTNSGVLVTSPGFQSGGGNTITFTGLLTNTSTGQINLNVLGDLLRANGGIANSGAIMVNNGATVDPPFLNNFGTVTIDSASAFVVGTGSTTGVGYIQLHNGTLGEMISPSAFGTITVAGPASLDGTLDILLQNGFNPSVGTTYQIILFSPGGLTGVFATIQNDIFNNGSEHWLIAYDNANGFVELTAAPLNSSTPEPATSLLLGTGLIGVSFIIRQRLPQQARSPSDSLARYRPSTATCCTIGR